MPGTKQPNVITSLNISAPRCRTRCAGLAYLFVVVLAGLQTATAGEPLVSEYALKAAIIYKIAKFVSWPDDAFTTREEPLSVCLPVADPIGPALDALTGKTVRGRPIEVRRFEADETVASDCKILFLSRAMKERRVALVSDVAHSPVLTIGDSHDFVDLGGIVSLEIYRNRIRFAINVGASTRAGLDISAQLLQLATIRNSSSER